MNIILQKDVKNLGKAGDSVKVKAGYARNYLLPNKLALTFDKSRAKEWKHKKQIIEAKKKQAFLLRKDSLEKLSKCELLFEKAGRGENLIFGSVTPVDISKALEEKYQIAVDKRDIKCQALKSLGEHKVTVQLDSELQTEITVAVRAKMTEKKNLTTKTKGFFSRLLKSKDDSTEEDESTQESDSATEENQQAFEGKQASAPAKDDSSEPDKDSESAKSPTQEEPEKS